MIAREALSICTKLIVSHSHWLWSELHTVYPEWRNPYAKLGCPLSTMHRLTSMTPNWHQIHLPKRADWGGNWCPHGVGRLRTGARHAPGRLGSPRRYSTSVSEQYRSQSSPITCFLLGKPLSHETSCNGLSRHLLSKCYFKLVLQLSEVQVRASLNQAFQELPEVTLLSLSTMPHKQKGLTIRCSPLRCLGLPDTKGFQTTCPVCNARLTMWLTVLQLTPSSLAILECLWFKESSTIFSLSSGVMCRRLAVMVWVS